MSVDRQRFCLPLKIGLSSGAMRSLIAIVTFVLAAFASAATYKWVDKNGVVHYSDRPQPGAELVELQPAQTFTPSRSSASSTTTQRPTPTVAQVEYIKLDLWKPENDDTFTNTAQQVDVRLRLEPALAAGHSIWLYLDGKRVDGLPQSGESFTLNDVYRGSHSLYAIVANSKGEPQVRSQTVTFHVQQTSLNSPQRQPQPVVTPLRPPGTRRPGG
jgi:hypothetical protein